MEKKKDLTIEELEKAREEAKKHFDLLDKQLKNAQKEAEEIKQKELIATRDSRKKEVDDAFNKWVELRKAYEADYGNYIFVSNSDGNKFPFWFF